VGKSWDEKVKKIYKKKLEITSPTGGGRSVGIVRVRTKATEFSFSLASCSPDPYPVFFAHVVRVLSLKKYDYNKN
jgi:hypothetical protein